MKKTEFLEIKNLDIVALIKKANGIRLDVANLIMDKNMNTLKDKKVIFKKRKDLAQILTVLRQKEILSELEGDQVVLKEEIKVMEKKGVKKAK